MPPDQPARLVVDRREHASPVPELLNRSAEIVLTTASLDNGDYALGSVLGIERKTGEDLARSVVDGRLFRQMGALRARYKRPLLFVEALHDRQDLLGVPWTALRGALVSVSVAFGIPVLRSADPEESANLILASIRQLRAPLAIPYVRPGYRPRGWRRRALYLLQGLPGVGPQRANALLSGFGSVEAVVTADIRTLSSVRGVGRALARSIRSALGPEPQ